MKNIEVSIVIPIYNVEKYLSECLDSIIKQNNKSSLESIEIIGVDDVTPDKSADIFRNYIDKYPKINLRLITHKNNKGLGGARNTGAKHAKGRFVFFLDSDDWLVDGAIESIIDKTKSINDENRIIVFGIDAIKDKKLSWRFSYDKDEVISNLDALERFSYDKIIPSGCSKLFPVDYFKEIGFCENLYYEDLEFTPRAFSISQSIELCKKSIYCYRLEGSSITRQKTRSKHIDDFCFVIESAYKSYEGSSFFSNLFFNRWLYSLKKWNLSEYLLGYALNRLYYFMNLYEVNPENEFASELFDFLNDICIPKRYNKVMLNQKSKLLSMLNDDYSQIVSISTVNKYFDKVYVLNLKKANKERFLISKQLMNYNIEFEYWDAVNGYSPKNMAKYLEYLEREVGVLTHFKEYNDLEKKRGKKFIESAGGIGYILSLIEILEDAKKNDYKSILCLEDDVILVDDFENKFNDFIDSINEDWKVIQLGASQYGWDNIDIKKAKRTKYYHQIPVSTCGSFAIGFNSTVYDEIIEIQKYFDGPFDQIPMGSIYRKYNKQCYVSFPNIIVPDVTTSDIREGRDQVAHGEKMKWDLCKYTFPAKKISLSIILTSESNIKYINVSNSEINTSFNVKWFVNTNIGIRPIHDNQYISCTRFNLEDQLNEFSYRFNTDFVFYIPSSTILTDELIFRKVSQLMMHSFANMEGISDQSSKQIISICEVYLPEIDSQKNAPKVSVIVPTFGTRKNLQHALESLQKQTFSEFEIIVVDDNGANSGNSKEVEQIIQDFGNSRIPIRYIKHKVNLNGAAARNTGILNSKGDYICFLDDDDIYYPKKIELSYNKLSKNSDKNIGGVYCGYKGWKSNFNDQERYRKGNLSFELLSLNFNTHYIHTNTTLYHKSALEMINGFDETFNRHQDLEMNLRFFQHYEMDVVNEILVGLKPNPKEANNRMRNEKLFLLKEKFLKRFENIISLYPIEEQKVIYNAHWSEVLRCFDNSDDFINYCKSRFSVGYLSLIIELLEADNHTFNDENTSNTLQNNKKFNSIIAKKNQRIDELQKALENSKSDLSFVPLWVIKFFHFFNG